MGAPHDVVVIGSGFGGAVSANRLSLSDLNVLVLERGPWRDSLPVRSLGIPERAPFPYGGRFVTHFVRSIATGRRGVLLNKHGMYELFSYPGIDALCVSAVGGGSHGWLGQLAEPCDSSYWANRHPDLRTQDVSRYYGKIRSDLGHSSDT